MGFSLMKERIRQTGASLYDEQVKDGRDELANGFTDDVSYNPYIADYYTGEPVPIKIYNQRYSANYGFTSQFLTLHDVPVPLGKLLYDTRLCNYWLCVESYNVSDIHNEGKLGLCGRFLKWQDKQGSIKQTPVIATSASKYNNGENGTSVLHLGSDQMLIYMQLNEDTVRLDRGAKFFIDENKESPSVYELTRTDTALYSYMGIGFLALIVTECAYTPTERELELGVCNYHAPRHPAPPPDTDEANGLSAVISGNTNLKVGFPRKYTVEFTDKDGHAVGWDDVGFQWDVSGDYGISFSSSGNMVELSVSDEGLIGSSFLLSVKIGGATAASIEIDIVKGW